MFLHFLKIFFSAKLFLLEAFKVLILPTVFILFVEYPDVIYAGSISVTASAVYGYSKVVIFGANILQTSVFGGSLTIGTCLKASSAGYRLVKLGKVKFENFDKNMLHFPDGFLKKFLTKEAFYRDAVDGNGAKSTVFRVIPELYPRYFSAKQQVLQEVIQYNNDLQKTTNKITHVALPCTSVLSKSELQHECETFISYYSNYAYYMRLAKKEIYSFEKENLELAKRIYVASFF